MLTPRLTMILKHIKGMSCADIGTDHAYIPIELAKKNIQVIATDIKTGPLKIAEKNAKKHEKNIELRLGAGLGPIGLGETDCIVIAGMGGEMIKKIIEDDLEKASASLLILQPMNSQYELRKYLIENGFLVVCEDIAKEGFKIYNLLVVKRGENPRYEREIDAHLPKSLYEHPLFLDLLDKKRREFSKIYKGLTKKRDKNDAELSYYKGLLADLEEIERSFKNAT